jgi:hypothetical protein
MIYVEVLPNQGVTKVQELFLDNIEREEGFDPSDPDAVRFKLMDKNSRYLENWQVLHFRLLGNDLFRPYGESILEHSRRLWRIFIQLEDAMLVYRVTRAVDRIIFYIDTSGIAANEIPNYIEQVRQSMRTNNAVDRVNGRLDQRHMPISVDDNLFIPTRPNDLTKIDNLAAGTNASHIEDIEYIHKRLTASTKIPRSYLGFQDGLSSKSTLSMEDIRFASTINSIQKIIIAELNQLAILHLYAKGFTGEDLVNFEIKLSNPSTIAIQQKLNLWNLKFETASKAKESGLVDEEFIQREILDLNSDTIINIRVGKEKDQMRNKTLEALQPPNPNKFQDDQSIIDPFGLE